MQSSLIEPVETAGADVARADKLIKTGENVFKFVRERDDGIVREVLTWFTKLIEDDDVLQSTQIDIKVLADIVATTGAAVDSFVDAIVKEEHHEKTIVDIGVLRYPDFDHPYFKVYRIQLTAWSDTRRILFFGKDANGITGTFNKRLFKPRDSVIVGMRDQAKEKAIEEADAMFV